MGIEDAWQWQLRHAIRTPAQLATHLNLTSNELDGLAYAQREGMPLLIPPYYLSLCDPNDPNCPIRRQCVPDPRESTRTKGDLEDPLGETPREVSPGLIRRYPDRALLIVTASCAVHCRFCTRSRVVGNHNGWMPTEQFSKAISWLRAHPEVKEVIVSGGDPLVASTRRIQLLLEGLRSIEHVEFIRLGTRVPTVLPMRITDDLVRVLRAAQPLYLMLHFNHPREVTEQACAALSRLADGGIPLMNQTVLLRGVNDDALTLRELFRALVRNRVRPYYLLHADAVAGTGHLRTSIRRSIAIAGELQGHLSGIALPKLMVDTPGGAGKVPLCPDSIVSMETNVTTFRTYTGDIVEVIDP